MFINKLVYLKVFFDISFLSLFINFIYIKGVYIIFVLEFGNWVLESTFINGSIVVNILDRVFIVVVSFNWSDWMLKEIY